MTRGGCPGVHEPMASGDGLLIRVKPFGGRLNAAHLRAIAQVAAACGNGTIELTGRGNIQLRGLSEASASSAAAALVAAGLADPDPARERRRNVIAVPPCDDALVARIEAVLAGIEGLAAKFCVAVGPADADIVLRDGMLGVAGVWMACTAEDAAETVARIAREAGGSRITSSLPLREGQSQLARHSGLVMAGLDPAIVASPAISTRSQAIAGSELDDDVMTSQRNRPDAISPSATRREQEGNAPPGVVLALPFGQTDACAIRALADLTGDREIRTTPWRAFQVPQNLDPVACATLGFITDPHDPRRSIAACPGAPACASATTATRADAAFLTGLGLRDIHVSGCAKGCAHPRPATTLVGAGGRYDLVRHGRAGDPPDAVGLTVHEIAEMLA